MTVTTRHRRSSATSQNWFCSRCSETSRPIVRVSTPSTPRASSSRKLAGRSDPTRNASTGSAIPLSCSGSTSVKLNRPRTWRCVSREIWIPPGGAAAWMRAARLTVSPTTTKSCPGRSSSELTTTSPVSIPTRISRVIGWPSADSALSC